VNVAGESGKIDPMYQFKIEPLAQLELAGYDVSFTNSSLFMVLVLGALWLFMAGGMKRDMVPGRWQMAVEGATGFINHMSVPKARNMCLWCSRCSCSS
jgi:F-type H+-transporting ATPase subunit a